MHGRTASFPIAAVTLPIGSAKLGRSAKIQHPCVFILLVYGIVVMVVVSFFFFLKRFREKRKREGKGRRSDEWNSRCFSAVAFRYSPPPVSFIILAFRELLVNFRSKGVSLYTQQRFPFLLAGNVTNNAYTTLHRNPPHLELARLPPSLSLSRSLARSLAVDRRSLSARTRVATPTYRGRGKMCATR